MASYHLSAKIVQRSSGKSVVAAAAYRSRSSIKDKSQGLTFDYSRKKDLAHSEILLPEHAPDRFKDRSVLWNEVEKVERRRDAQLAREIELALPGELTLNQNIELVREFVKLNFVDQGMIADVNIHTKKDNPHAHILLTTREVTAQPPAATKLLIGMASPMWYEQGYTTYPGSGGCHGDIYTTTREENHRCSFGL